MTKEEAIADIKNNIKPVVGGKSLDMAIEALKAEPIRCGECKHQDECEEVVLFDVNDDEVMGHRLHWCSYGERKGGEEE